MTSDEGDVADKSLAGLLCSTSGEGCLKGVRAFVDVHTEDGADSSGVFIDMLKSLGARVFSRPTETCTHIIYKSGKGSTLTWYRKQEEKPHIVSVRWVMKCKEAGMRLEEVPYAVRVEEEDVFAKARKSMEPKHLFSMSMTSSTTSNPDPPTIPIIIEPARVKQARSVSLKYAPKISSPLKKAYGDENEYF